MITADGELLRVSRSATRTVHRCRGRASAAWAWSAPSRCVEPAYEVEQVVYEGLPFRRCSPSWTRCVGRLQRQPVHRLAPRWSTRSGSSVAPTTGPGSEPTGWARGRHASPHPVAGMSPDTARTQLASPVRGMSGCRTSGSTTRPAAGAELQSEYLVPARPAVAALRAMRALRDRVAPVLQVSEIRTVAADDLWLSPAYGTDRWACTSPGCDDAARVRPCCRRRGRPRAVRRPPALGQGVHDLARRRRRALPAVRRRPRPARALDPDDAFGNAFLDAYLPR